MVGIGKGATLRQLLNNGAGETAAANLPHLRLTSTEYYVCRAAGGSSGATVSSRFYLHYEGISNTKPYFPRNDRPPLTDRRELYPRYIGIIMNTILLLCCDATTSSVDRSISTTAFYRVIRGIRKFFKTCMPRFH